MQVSNNFQVQTNFHPEVTAALIPLINDGLCSQFGGTPSGDFISGIECLSCKENECYTKTEKPFAVYCNHKNRCGAVHKYTAYFPDLHKDVYASVTRSTKDSHFIARSYALKRGLPGFEQHGGSFGSLTLEGKSYSTLDFRLSDGVTFNKRLIDGPRKTHNTGPVKGLIWVPASGVDTSKPIYLAEAPIKAMGLLEARYQAISVTSSNANPKDCVWIKEHGKSIKKLCLAFDNDLAGKKATDTWINYCEEEKIPFEVYFPVGGDWDELQQSNKLDARKMTRCKLEGQYFTAKTPMEAAQCCLTLLGGVGEVLMWKGFTYSVSIGKDETGSTCIEAVNEIIAGSLSGAYSAKIDGVASIDERPEYLNCLKVTRAGEVSPDLVFMNGRDLSSKKNFNEALLNATRIAYKGQDHHLMYIIEKIIKLSKLEVVRQIDRFGYDEKSKAFIFKQLAVDKDGITHKPNTLGFFEALGIKAPTNYNKSAVMTKFPSIDMGWYIDNMWEAYGAKGFAVLGYYVATYFSHIHFNERGYHPFLSVVGPRGGGKSGLILKLNEAFTFIRSEGIGFTKANTGKGLVRSMADRVNLPICFLEGNKQERLNMDEQEFLTLYNRNSSQTTAMRTMDLSTRSIPFDAGIIMAQMREVFKDAGVKQRFITINFPERNSIFSEKEKTSFLRLIDKTLCDVGVQVLQKRKAFEKEWSAEFESWSKVIAANGIPHERMQGNHAVVLTGASLFLKFFCPRMDIANILIKSVETLVLEEAHRKVASSIYDENDLADSFFDAFETLRITPSFNGDDKLQRNRHYLEDCNHYYIRLTEVLSVMCLSGYAFANRTKDVLDALRLSPRFVQIHNKRSFDEKWNGGQQVQRCWWFLKQSSEN